MRRSFEMPIPTVWPLWCCLYKTDHFAQSFKWVSTILVTFQFQIPSLNFDHSSSEEDDLTSPESLINPIIDGTNFLTINSTVDGINYLSTLGVPGQWRTAPGSRQDSISSCGSLMVITFHIIFAL